MALATVLCKHHFLSAPFDVWGWGGKLICTLWIKPWQINQLISCLMPITWFFRYTIVWCLVQRTFVCSRQCLAFLQIGIKPGNENTQWDSLEGSGFGWVSTASLQQRKNPTARTDLFQDGGNVLPLPAISPAATYRCVIQAGYPQIPAYFTMCTACVYRGTVRK